MEYIEDRNTHGNLDRLFGGISLRGEDGTVLGCSVGYLYVFSKGSKYGSCNVGACDKLNISVIWVI